MLTKEERNNELVKSLLEGGFDEDVIKSWIDSGDLVLAKSEGDEEPDPDDRKDPEDSQDPANKPDPDEEPDPDDSKDPEEEDEEEEEKKPKKGCGKDADIKKSLGDFKDDIMKSIHDEVESQLAGAADDISKAVEGMISDKVSSVLEKLEKSMDSMVRIMSNQVPGFKGANLSRAVIEKSLGNRAEGDDKAIMSVSRDREAVRELISKSIQEEENVELRKSLIDGTREYLIDPLYGEINREAAQYMYDKKGVRLVK